MRFSGVALLFVVAGCSRNLDLPDPPPPPQPGTVQGRTVFAQAGMSERTPAAGARISVLGSDAVALSKVDGLFRVTGIVKDTGTLLFRFDADGDGAFDRQRVIDLADIGAGPGRDISLGDVVLSQNARMHGKATRGNVPGAGGHGGTVVFVPEGPFTTYTNDDGTWTLKDLPEGELRITFFRVGYDAFLIDAVTLRSGEDFAVRDVQLVASTTPPDPGSIAGQVRFSPAQPDATGTGVVAFDALGTTTAGVVMSDGTFTIANVPPGLYTVQASRSGHFNAALPNVLVTPGARSTVSALVLVAITGDEPDAGAIAVPDSGTYVFDAGSALPDGGTACVQGASCPAGTCALGVVDCRPQGALCVPTGAAPDGASCGSGLICRSGACTVACVAGRSCALPATSCHVGVTACAGTVETCIDTGGVLGDGASCGAGLYCRTGVCGACNAGATCPLGAGSCRAGYLACDTGLPVCTDSMVPLANGATCDVGKVCNAGACVACAQGGGCAPQSNPCHSGTLSCATGAPVCNDTGNTLADGAQCGTNQVCFMGACSACTTGASCTPPTECRLGAVSCGTGEAVCVSNGNASNGTGCDGGTCVNGSCSAGGSSIGVLSGDGQSAGPFELLPSPVVVVVTGDAGQPVVGVQVTVTAPPGASAAWDAGTDPMGRVSLTLKLARNLGAQTFTVNAPSLGRSTTVNATAAQVADGVIYTLINQTRAAGDTSGGTGPDTRLSAAAGIAVAKDGTVYVSDYYNNKVKKLSPLGVVSLVAGAGGAGFQGDNGQATAANLYHPNGLALDESQGSPGFLYIADEYYSRVRVVDLSTGLIYRYAGGGSASTNDGDLGPADQAVLSSPGMIALGPENPPWLYIGDNGHERVRRVDPTTRIIYPWLSRGACSAKIAFFGCNGSGGCSVQFDPAGNAFVGGSLCGTETAGGADGIVRIDADGGMAHVLGFNGGGLGEGLNARRSHVPLRPIFTLDAAGNLFYASYSGSAGGSILRRIDSATGAVTTVAGTSGVEGGSGDYGPATAALLNGAWMPVFDPVNRRDLYFSDDDNNAVRVIRNAGAVTPGRATLSTFANPTLTAFIDQIPAQSMSVQLRDDANLPLIGFDVRFISVTGGGYVQPVATTTLNGVASVVPRPGLLPRDYLFTASFDDIHGQPVTGSPQTFRITAIAPDAGTLFDAVNDSHVAGDTFSGPGVLQAINTPSGLTADPAGNVYFGSYYNNRIMRLAPDGTLTRVAGTSQAGLSGDYGPATLAELYHPVGIAHDAARGRLYFADEYFSRVRMIDLDGGYIYPVTGGSPTTSPYGDNGPALSAFILNPGHVRLRGNTLYVAQWGHDRIRRIDLTTNVIDTYLAPAGTCAGAANFVGCGSTNWGCDLAWDQAGNAYVSGDFCGTDFNGTARGVARIESNGSLTQVAGYVAGGTGSNVPASTAAVPAHVSLGFDAQGRLLLVAPHTLRAIDLSSDVITTLGGGSAGYAGNYQPVSSALFSRPFEMLLLPGGHIAITDSDNHAIRILW